MELTPDTELHKASNPPTVINEDSIFSNQYADPMEMDAMSPLLSSTEALEHDKVLPHPYDFELSSNSKYKIVAAQLVQPAPTAQPIMTQTNLFNN